MFLLNLDYKEVTGHPKKTTTLNNNEHIETENAHCTNGTFGFARSQANPSQNQMSHFFANAPDNINKLDIDKLLKNVQYIAPF